MDKSEMPIRVDVKVTPHGEKPDSETSPLALVKVRRWLIADTDPSVAKLARFRTDHPLTAYNAWTASIYLARWFMTKREAAGVLRDMNKERLILAERLARKAELVRPDNPASF